MRKILATACLAVLICAPQTMAQQRQTRSQNKSFEEFRKGILNDYQDFRKTLLDNYADFLNGEWHEYQSLNAERRDKTPKPKTVPEVKTPASPKTPKPAEVHVPQPSVPAPSDADVRKRAEAPAKPAVVKSSGRDEFEFFTLPVQVPHIEFNIAQKLYSNNDYAAQWRELARADVASNLLPHLISLAKAAGLNDYLTFQLAKSYIDARFPQADITSRTSAVHYLLANMGFDARIATTAAGDPLLLIPFDQTIYARTFMMIDDRKYYVFGPEGFDMSKAQKIMTCRLPEDADAGKVMGLTLGELKIPFKGKSFDLEYGPIHLTGEVNANLMPILYHYPQMPVSGFALSNVQPDLRESLVRQMRSQLQGMSGDQKVEQLLAFMHKVFDYATDEDFHGFEKPYFLEETLYYPKNDCEDRAIFYTYFLWNALDREAQLVSFPGHEAATVRMDAPIEGTGYEYDGTLYYISDPTFLGSHTGQIMPPYRTTPPKVDYTFSR